MWLKSGAGKNWLRRRLNLRLVLRRGNNCDTAATITGPSERAGNASLNQSVYIPDRLSATRGALRWLTGSNRQALDCLQARPLAPFNLGLVYREHQFRPPLKQGFQCASAFDARELMAKAEVDPGAEGDVPVRPPLEIELLGMRGGADRG